MISTSNKSKKKRYVSLLREHIKIVTYFILILLGIIGLGFIVISHYFIVPENKVMGNIFEAIGIALVVSVTSSFLYQIFIAVKQQRLFAEQLEKELSSIGTLCGQAKKISLEGIYTRDEIKNKINPLKKMTETAKEEDEILIAGRTLYKIAVNNKDDFKIGLDNGAHFKLLCLDDDKLLYLDDEKLRFDNEIQNSMKINTNMLVKVPVNHIKTDSASALQRFREICNEAEEKCFNGSFKVNMCDFIIPNSFTCFTRKEKRTSILDFSFGIKEGEKYALFFEHDSKDENHFGNRLYKYYKGLFDKGKKNPELQYSKKKACFTKKEYEEFLNKFSLKDKVLESLIINTGYEVCIDLNDISDNKKQELGDKVFNEIVNHIKKKINP